MKLGCGPIRWPYQLMTSQSTDLVRDWLLSGSLGGPRSGDVIPSPALTSSRHVTGCDVIPSRHLPQSRVEPSQMSFVAQRVRTYRGGAPRMVAVAASATINWCHGHRWKHSCWRWDLTRRQWRQYTTWLDIDGQGFGWVLDYFYYFIWFNLQR